MLPFSTDSLLVAIPVLLAGVALVLWSVERFVDTISEAAVGLGLSPFLLTVLLAGTDLENAVLGGAAVLGDLPDVGVGTVFGEALFILCAATGLAGVLVPFAVDTPRRYLALTAVSPVLLLALSYDGQLSGADGALLVAAYGAALALLYRWEQHGPHSYLEMEEDLEEESGSESTLAALGVLALATLGMAVGSQLVVEGTKGVLSWLGLSGLAFGATLLSFVASIEEVFLTVEPVRKGRPTVAVGNVVGSMIFFVTANAGVLALLRPLRLPTAVFGRAVARLRRRAGGRARLAGVGADHAGGGSGSDRRLRAISGRNRPLCVRRQRKRHTASMNFLRLLRAREPSK